MTRIGSGHDASILILQIGQAYNNLLGFYTCHFSLACAWSRHLPPALIGLKAYGARRRKNYDQDFEVSRAASVVVIRGRSRPSLNSIISTKWPETCRSLAPTHPCRDSTKILALEAFQGHSFSSLFPLPKSALCGLGDSHSLFCRDRGPLSKSHHASWAYLNFKAGFLPAF